MANTHTQSDAPASRTKRAKSKAPVRKAAARKAPAKRVAKRVVEDRRSIASGMMDLTNEFARQTHGYAEMGDRAAGVAKRFVRDGARTAERTVGDIRDLATGTIDGALTVSGRYGSLVAERFREQPLATVAGLGVMAFIAAWLVGRR